jgi:hypothetical protein
MFFSLPKIVCTVLIYYDLEIIRRALQTLLELKSALDIIIVENGSEFTESKIKPYMLKLLENKKISKYILFNKNISNNAFEVVFEERQIDYEHYDYMLLTDGDLECEDNSWLAEELSILESNPDAFCCAVSLDMSNLPLNTFPDAISWVPDDIRRTQYYAEGLTGAHLLLLRVSDFEGFWKFKKKNGLRFLDNAMHHYCYHIARKKWLKTALSKARHLTWDVYSNLEHPYTKHKLGMNLGRIWNHDFQSSYEVYTPDQLGRKVK